MGNASVRNRNHPATPNQYLYPNHPPLHYYQYQGFYYPPLQAPYGGDQGARVPYGAMPSPLLHQKAVNIRIDINLKKKTLRFEPDEEDPGKFLLSFTFDAMLSGSITVMFFAKEEEEGNLTATKEDQFPSSTFTFTEGMEQKYKQPCGTGIDFSALSETELVEANDADVYHVTVKVETNDPEFKTANSQITHAVIEKDEEGEYKARVVKQILWVNRTRYELQEIHGVDEKKCVVCLTEPKDTTVLPCRHMCMCSGCAKLLRFQTNHCPICKQRAERFLEITLNTNGANQ